MTTYLYVKTHTITGLKYLGQTKKADPHKYRGSGLRWLNHLRVHGNHYTTEILKECEHSAMVQFWGQYYSDLWNIVESDEWANLKPETGDGSKGAKWNDKQRRAHANKVIWNKGKGKPKIKKGPATGERNASSRPEVREKIRQANKGKPRPYSAEIGRKSAAKISATVTGRKRCYKEDGSWTWVYPKQSPHEGGSIGTTVVD